MLTVNVMGRKIAKALGAVAAITALLVVVYQGSVASASAVTAGVHGERAALGAVEVVIDRGSVGYTGG